MKKIENDFYVLWAAPPGEDVPFEVSREVSTPLIPECESSPYCPGERIAQLAGRPDPGQGRRLQSVVTFESDPEFVFEPDDCPRRFPDKEACYRAINRMALRDGCIPADLLSRTGNFLKALGYRVWAERVGRLDLEGDRILVAHGPIFNFHELRCEHAPGGIVLYLIRNPRENERPRSAREL